MKMPSQKGVAILSELSIIVFLKISSTCKYLYVEISLKSIYFNTGLLALCVFV